MQKGERVFRLFVPTHQDTPKPVHPAMRAFDHPAPCFEPRFALEFFGFCTPRKDMRREPKFCQDIAHFLIAVAFVQTHALRVCHRGCRALDHEAVERRPHQFHIMPIGPIHRHPQRHAVALGQQAALDAAVGAVGRIGTSFFPLRGALWSWRHPCSARPSQCLATRQTGPLLLSRGLRKRPLRPMPESDHGPWIWHITRSAAGRPIGSPCGARRKWHQHSDDPARAAVRPQSDADSHALGARVAGQPTGHRKCETRSSCDCLVCVYVSVVVVVMSSCRKYTSYSDRLLARLYPFGIRSTVNKHLGLRSTTRIFECLVQQPTFKKCKLLTINGLYYQAFKPRQN